MVEIIFLNAERSIRILVDWEHNKVYFMGPRSNTLIGKVPERYESTTPEDFADKHNLILIKKEPSDEEISNMMATPEKELEVEEEPEIVEEEPEEEEEMKEEISEEVESIETYTEPLIFKLPKEEETEIPDEITSEEEEELN